MLCYKNFIYSPETSRITQLVDIHICTATPLLTQPHNTQLGQQSTVVVLGVGSWIVQHCVLRVIVVALLLTSLLKFAPTPSRMVVRTDSFVWVAAVFIISAVAVAVAVQTARVGHADVVLTRVATFADAVTPEKATTSLPAL